VPLSSCQPSIDALHPPFARLTPWLYTIKILLRIQLRATAQSMTWTSMIRERFWYTSIVHITQNETAVSKFRLSRALKNGLTPVSTLPLNMVVAGLRLTDHHHLAGITCKVEGRRIPLSHCLCLQQTLKDTRL
jgi:hypothetical protein